MGFVLCCEDVDGKSEMCDKDAFICDRVGGNS